MKANLRRRVIILGVVVIFLLLLIFGLRFLLILEPPYELAMYHLTATAIREHNAAIEGFIQQTQAAMTPTPAQ